MARLLEGKVAVITGGATGIGLAIAKRFAAEGASVVISGRRQAELDKATAQLGGDVLAVQSDCAKIDDLTRLYAAVKARHRRLDIVVANAAILELEPMGAITEEAVDRQLGVNFKGVIFTVQHALPLMPDGAAVILLGSAAAGKGMGQNSVYAATKAAVRSFARSWITDLKPRRIRVNVVTPGAIPTAGSSVDFAEIFAAFEAQTPLGRLGVPDEIASVVTFLASDDGVLINGAEIQADGGWAQI